MPGGLAIDLFEQHQGTHILQVFIKTCFRFLFPNIDNGNNKEKTFFPSNSIVTWWFCFGTSSRWTISLYIWNSFNLFRTITGKYYILCKIKKRKIKLISPLEINGTTNCNCISELCENSKVVFVFIS